MWHKSHRSFGSEDGGNMSNNGDGGKGGRLERFRQGTKRGTDW